MKKTDFLTKVQSITGFVSVLKDIETQDNIKESDIEKRQLSIEHTNKDGTAGVTSVFYLENKKTGEVRFYNDEPKSFEKDAVSDEAKKQQSLEAYLTGKYQAFFVNRIDIKNLWAEADVYQIENGKLRKKTVVVYKKGGEKVSDVDVI